MLSSFWFGTIRLNDTLIQIEAYSAIEYEGSKIEAHLRHDGCHRRVQMKKTCEEHGELREEEVVKGFECRPGQFIVLSRPELDALSSKAGNRIVLEDFISAQNVEPTRFDGKAYYALPAGREARPLYSALHQALTDEGVYGIGQITTMGRERLVLITTVKRLIVMIAVHYADKIRPAAMFDANIKQSLVSNQQVAAFKEFIKAHHRDDSCLNEFQDPYQQRLVAALNAKMDGNDVIHERPKKGFAVKKQRGTLVPITNSPKKLIRSQRPLPKPK